MHPKGTSFGAPAAKFFARLDLDQNPSFLDEHLGRYAKETVYNFVKKDYLYK